MPFSVLAVHKAIVHSGHLLSTTPLKLGGVKGGANGEVSETRPTLASIHVPHARIAPIANLRSSASACSR